MQPQIHLIDETWLDVGADTVSAAVADSANWVLWWPTLSLTVTRDRGVKGMQWSARSVGWRVPMRGTAEIWLEPFASGVILHHFLRLDAENGPLSTRAAKRRTRQLAWHAKRVFWVLKDELESAAAAR